MVPNFGKHEMFEHFCVYDKIIVTGPQRCGTRIATKMIAVDLGYKFFSELLVAVDNFGKLRWLLRNESHFVVQCPALSHRVHELDGDDFLIVFMRRAVDDVLASERRIRWSGRGEQRKYEGFARFYDVGDPICVRKTRVWDRFQKGMIRHALDLEYRLLTGHPLWVPKANRRLFRPGQIDDQETEASSDGLSDAV